MFDSQYITIPYDGEILESIHMYKYGQVLYRFKGEDNNEYMIKQVLKEVGQKEWDINMALSEHKTNDNIITVYNVKETNSHYFIQMEYCQTKSIEHMTFNSDQIVQLLYDITNGLKGLNKMNIIHRDIKPQNIVYQQNSFKLIDFGTAKRLKNVNECELNSKQTGTLIFMAPQVYLGMNYSSKCDIWSLGSTIYYILYRKSVWQQLNINKCNAQAKWNEYMKGDRNLQLDLFSNVRQNQFSEVILKMMQIEENDRFSLKELMEYISHTFQQVEETLYTDRLTNYQTQRQTMFKRSVLSIMSQLSASQLRSQDNKQVIEQFQITLLKQKDNIDFVMVLRVLRDYLQKTYGELNELEDRAYYQNLIVIIDSFIYLYQHPKINIWDNQQHIRYCKKHNQLKHLLEYLL